MSDTDSSDDFDIVSQMEDAEQEWQISQNELSEIVSEEIDSSVKTSEIKIVPKKLFDILRNFGLTLGESVADLIDNSIDSGAKNVNVQYTINHDLAVRYLIVGDDGKGMTGDELDEALTLGADRIYKETDTGKIWYRSKISITMSS